MIRRPPRPPASRPIRRRHALGMAVVGLALALSAPAGAQNAARPNQGSAPPYEADMLRLAEMLGALHYIRPLCGAPDAGRWRDEMQGLIDTEQPSDERRGLLIAAFNRGYESYRQGYRSCTPSAELAAQRYLEAGARLSRDIAARYGSN
ncbi:TIGR02301 family protein [Ancylobacter sonchi]|nr:TIGR02301 family protein [Ancylobacter sonchi]